MSLRADHTVCPSPSPDRRGPETAPDRRRALLERRRALQERRRARRRGAAGGAAARKGSGREEAAAAGEKAGLDPRPEILGRGRLPPEETTTWVEGAAEREKIRVGGVVEDVEASGGGKTERLARRPETLYASGPPLDTIHVTTRDDGTRTKGPPNSRPDVAADVEERPPRPELNEGAEEPPPWDEGAPPSMWPPPPPHPVEAAATSTPGALAITGRSGAHSGVENEALTRRPSGSTENAVEHGGDHLISATLVVPEEEQPVYEATAVRLWSTRRIRMIFAAFLATIAAVAVVVAIVQTSGSDPASQAAPQPPQLVWKQLGEDIYGIREGDYFGTSIAMSDNGAILAIGAPIGGYVRVYQFTRDMWGPWSPMGYGIYDEEQNGYFGCSVSVSANGTVLAVGKMLGGNAGQVYVYGWKNETWVPIGQEIDGQAESDEFFGGSVSLSADGTALAVGGSSFARVFRLVGGNWTQMGGALRGENYSGGYFGTSVSLSGDGTTVAVNAPWNGTTPGFVRLFGQEEDGWAQVGQDIDFEGEGVDSLSLSRDGMTVAIGTVSDSLGPDIGRARVFGLQEGNWSQGGRDIVGEEESVLFCPHVALSANGTTAAVRGFSRVRVHTLTEGNWTQLGPDVVGHDQTKCGPDRLIAISANGTVLAVAYVSKSARDGGGTGTVSVYQLRNEQAL